MDSIRCVIANMPRQLLGDILENTIGQSVDIEVVKRVEGIDQVTSILARETVDLVVMGMKRVDLPEHCLGIMDDSPNLAIIGLVEDGRRLAAFVDDVGADDILQLIRSLCRAGSDSNS